VRIIVDTSVWSLALRRKIDKQNKQENLYLKELVELIKSNNVVTIGPIRQEILSGIVSVSQFERIKTILKSYIDFPIFTIDYELAAEYYNFCRKNGIQGSHIDFLICSVATDNKLSIFTTDKDFENFSKYVPIKLHQCRDL
jgi:predicted nucleic acid-binding protein